LTTLTSWEATQGCFGQVTHDHGGKADIKLFHFSIKAQAARRKSLDERVPFDDKLYNICYIPSISN
jgi:hypothetical protein